MPLLDFFIIDYYTKIVTWEVSEDFNYLLKFLQLNHFSMNKYNVLSEKQKREYLGLKLCCKVLSITDEILYFSDGSPYITSDYCISISHSHDLVSLGISKKKIGIDIEKNRYDRILTIKKKFIHEFEDLYSALSNESDYLHIIWGIKEGLFKLYYQNLWNFKFNYRVNFFELKSNILIICWILTKVECKQYYASYKIINNYFLTYVLNYNLHRKYVNE